jgi:hypothetical protein
VTHAELKQLLEDQAVAQAVRGTALAQTRAAIFTHLAATACNVPHGRLAELGELMRLAPVQFSRAIGEVGVSFTPRHCDELVAGVVSRLRPEDKDSTPYAPKRYREVMRR